MPTPVTVDPAGPRLLVEPLEQLADGLERGARAARVRGRLLMLQHPPVGGHEAGGHGRAAHVHPDDDARGPRASYRSPKCMSRMPSRSMRARACRIGEAGQLDVPLAPVAAVGELVVEIAGMGHELGHAARQLAQVREHALATTSTRPGPTRP